MKRSCKQSPLPPPSLHSGPLWVFKIQPLCFMFLDQEFFVFSFMFGLVGVVRIHKVSKFIDLWGPLMAICPRSEEWLSFESFHEVLTSFSPFWHSWITRKALDMHAKKATIFYDVRKGLLDSMSGLLEGLRAYCSKLSRRSSHDVAICLPYRGDCGYRNCFFPSLPWCGKWLTMMWWPVELNFSCWLWLLTC